MKLSDVSIKRPIFTSMIMLAIVVFGAVMYGRLSVDLFPKVDFPIVTVTVVYPGADPETMETKVADPIEEAVNSFIAYTMQCHVVALDTILAREAAELCKRLKLSTADAIIYATAFYHGADIVTCDAHFKDLEHVIYVPKTAE